MTRAMKGRSLLAAGVSAVAIGSALIVLALGPAGATPPSGLTSVILSKGTTAKALTEHVDGISFQASGPVDIYSVHNTFDPGGTTGWHSHPGFVFVTVTVGTLTRYLKDCDKHSYTVGQVIVERPNQVLVVRNEGSGSAETITTQFFPAGTTPRTDQPQPAHCAVS